MKFLALFCLVGFAAASSLHSSVQEQQQQQGSGSMVPNKLQWLPGHEYTFDYEGRLLSGLPQIQAQYAGLGLKCQVRVAVTRSEVQPENQRFTIKIEQPQYVSVAQKLDVALLNKPKETVSTTQSNWRNVRLPAYTPVTGEALRQLSMPAAFELRGDGQFQDIVVDTQDGDWSLNFKKAVAVLFQTKSIQLNNGVHINQISNDDSMAYWQTYEAGLDGNCQVDYQVQQLSKSRAQELSKQFTQECLQSGSQKAYLITKTRNLDSCTQRSTYNFYNPGMYRCATSSQDASGNCEGQWTRTSVTQYYACGQSINQLQIQSIHNEGELQQDMFGEKTERFTSGSSQNLKLVGKSQQITLSKVQHGKKLHTLSFVPQIEGAKTHQQNSVEMENGIQGSSGYGILSTSQVDQLKQAIKQLIGEIISHDLTKQTQQATKNEISMKVIALSRTFAKLNEQDIKSIYGELKSQYQGQNLYTMKTIVFDTVLMGGSVQNIRFVKEMAQQNEMTTGQLISFFLNVPRYLEVPQEELLQEIFHLFRTQNVQKNQMVYNQAVLSFSNLIQRACLSSQRNSSYPVYTTNQKCHHNSQVVVDMWIPFLQQQLQQEVPQYINTEWKNLHIVALGQMKHISALPTLLKFVELNEQINGEQTTQQQRDAQRLTRMVALYSLTGAGRADSRKTIEVLSAILKNQAENPEMRIAAFDVLLKMNPDMYILQSIAAMTWRESNQDVLSVINSAFFTLAHQKENPIFEVQGSSIRRKAFLILPLLKKTQNTSSATIITGDRLDLLGVYYSHIMSWSSSNGNSFGLFPSHIYNKLTYLLNRYQFTAVEGGLKMKGMDNLIQQLVEVLVPGSSQVTKKEIGQKIVSQLTSEWRQIVQKLNIKSRDYEGALAGFYLNLFEDTTMFHSFKSENSNELRQKMQWALGMNPQDILSNMCGKHQVNLVKMVDVAPTRYIVPSEMGFPINVDINSVATMLLKGNVEVQCGSDVVPTIKPDVRALLATQYSGYVKVLCPFSQSFNILGADEQMNIDLPIQGQIKYISQEQRFQMTMVTKPSFSQQNFDVVFHHVRPFTVKAQVTDIKPYPYMSSFQIVSPNAQPEQFKNVDYTFGESLGLNFEFVMTSEKKTAGLSALVHKFQMYNSDVTEAARFFFASAALSRRGYPSLQHHQIYLAMKPQQSQTSEIDVTVTLGYATRLNGQTPKYTYVKKAENQAQQAGEFDYPQWRKLIQVTTQSDNINHVQNSAHHDRAQKLNQLFQQKNIQTGRSVYVKTVAILKTNNGRGQQVLTSEIKLVKGQDQKMMKQEWYTELVNGQNQKVMCMQGHVTPIRPIASGMSLEALRTNPIEYRYENILNLGGNQCSESSLKVQGVAKVSQQQIQHSRQSQQAQELQALYQKNASLAQVSQLEKIVRLQASTLDIVTATVEMRNMRKTVKVSNVLVSLAKSLWWPYQENFRNTQPQVQRQGQENLKRQWNIRFDSESNTFQANLTNYDEQAQQEVSQVVFEPVQMPYYGQSFLPLNGVSRSQALKTQAAPSGKQYRCEMNGNMLSTWQKALLPMSQLDQCQHLIAADCSYRKSFAVLARSTGNNGQQKEVEIVSGYTKIVLSQQQSSSSQITVKVNGSSVVLPTQANQPLNIQDQKNDLIAVIYKTQEGTIEVATVLERFTQQNFLTVKYQPNNNGQSGNYVSVLVDASYRGGVCGICGELSGDQIMDLSGPRQCMFSKPELLIASYRNQCQQSQLPQQIAQELAQEQQQCQKAQTKVSQVLKSYLQNYGGECFRHIHIVVEKPDEICLSRVPVPDCTGSLINGQNQLVCRPTEQVEKTVSYTCFSSQDSKAQQYKQRAIQGQIISELRNYPVSALNKQALPKACQKVHGF